jgi:hypothetical protein
LEIQRFFLSLFKDFLDFDPLFLGFDPLLKTKVGHEKPSIYAGFRHFGPLSHFFFYLIAIKSLININNRAIKSGFLGQA